MTRATTKKSPSSPAKRRSRGFVQTGGILHQRIRKATEKRGFVETRLLTNWAEIAGEATASVARPVKVSYGREGIGATLTLLVNGANAPMVQTDLLKIKERVNACYGYAAISRIRLTQTAAVGFSEASVPFRVAPAKSKPKPTETQKQAVKTTVADVSDSELKQALENLGQSIVSRAKS